MPAHGWSVSNSCIARCKSMADHLLFFKNGNINSFPFMKNVNNALVIKTNLCMNSFPEKHVVEQLWSSVPQRQFRGILTRRVNKPKSRLEVFGTRNGNIITICKKANHSQLDTYHFQQIDRCHVSSHLNRQRKVEYWREDRVLPHHPQKRSL
jgi:hypothetical protein